MVHRINSAIKMGSEDAHIKQRICLSCKVNRDIVCFTIFVYLLIS